MDNNENQNAPIQNDQPQENAQQPAPQAQPQETPEQEFVRKYKALCDETGYTIVTIPQFVLNNQGNFDVRVRSEVAKMPNKES